MSLYTYRESRRLVAKVTLMFNKPRNSFKQRDDLSKLYITEPYARPWRWTPDRAVRVWALPGSLCCCVVFLGQAVYSQSACPHPGVHMDSGEFNVAGNPAMDKHSIQGRSRNTPSWQNANNQDLNSAEEWWTFIFSLYKVFKLKENIKTHQLHTLYSCFKRGCPTKV